MTSDAVALQQAAQLMDVALDDAALNQLLAYLELLQKWNRRHNLTAVREPSQMLAHHLIDSLAIVTPLRRFLQNDAGPDRLVGAIPILDVGSGAGLPGVVLATVAQQYRVTCIDAVEKKTAFIRQVALELRLANLAVRHGRVEELVDDDIVAPKFKVIVSRAFAALDKFVGLTQAALEDGGVWLAMKGRVPTAELEALPSAVEVFHVEQLSVPGLDAARCIVWMRRRNSNGRIPLPQQLR